MSGNQPRSRWGGRESYVKDIKYPDSSLLSECRSLSSQASKEQKIPSLTSDHKYLNNKASGRSLGCCPFESSWRSALLKTQKIKKGSHHFIDPFAGAPPEYIQRLSEMKSFQCETIRQEKNKTLKKGKKQETWTS